MVFKSLIVLAIAASLGRIAAAPLGERNLCQGLWCARFVPKDGHSDLSRRLAQFDGYNVTLSSSTPEESTPAINPSSTTSSFDPFSTAANPSSTTSSFDPFSTSSTSSSLSIDPSSFDPFFSPSSTFSGDPSSSTPPGDGPATITVTSTVFLNPTQSPPPDSGLSSTLPDSGSSSLATPSGTIPGGVVSLNPTLSEPNGELSSFSPPSPSPTVVLLTGGLPDPADQPTPSPTPGIIFLPPGN